MPTIRVHERIAKELDLIARALGTNRSAVVREAIMQYLEDNKDLILAKDAEARSKGSKPLRQLRQEFLL